MIRNSWILSCILITIVTVGYSQSVWTWTSISNLPDSIADNALCEAITNEGKFVYSFGGIGDSLHPKNVHQHVYKYNVINDSWSYMTNVPDTLGTIGRSASFVNDRIYLIGGKYIFDDSLEIPSSKNFVYNPNIDFFENEGASLPIPVSNHVQSVWRDSLIFVVGGREGDTNSLAVQIYNPFQNSWQMGTPLPNQEDFGAFGASGFIMKDTLFFFGGIKEDSVFSISKTLRKGIIDKENPTEIEWIVVNENFGSPLYKATCSGHGDIVFWIGGAEAPYNYNGKLLYSQDTVDVLPNEKLMELNLKSKTQTYSFDELNQLMDFGGVAKLGGGNWIIAGGIDKFGLPSNKTFLIHNPSLSDVEKAIKPPYFEIQETDNQFIIKTENVGNIKIYDITGKTIYKNAKHLADLKISKNKLGKGILLFVYEDNINIPLLQKKINP